MAHGETGFSDIMYDLVSLQYHALKGGHNYGKYIHDAEEADKKEIADFFRGVMEEDARRAEECHHFLGQLSGTEAAGSRAS